MGNLLRLLTREEPPEPEVFVDFENAQPTDAEFETFYLTEKVLEQAGYVLEDLRHYQGASDVIREAINHCGDVHYESQAWGTVVPLVFRLKMYYEMALQLERVVPQLLWDLCAGPLPPMKQLEIHQALAKQLAELLDFVLSFDELKMTTPAIQNDFSYYRRVLSKMPEIEPNNPTILNPELANTISLFYAHPTPMLNTLSRVVSRFVSQNQQLPIENSTDTLSTFANVCRKMVENPTLMQRFNNADETLMFCLRVMVGAIILYDHVHPVGAFAKCSPVDIKAVVRLLKQQPMDKIENLLNALRYTTKHLNDATTPKSIKNIIFNA